MIFRYINIFFTYLKVRKGFFTNFNKNFCKIYFISEHKSFIRLIRYLFDTLSKNILVI